jgi:hypothetical protein
MPVSVCLQSYRVSVCQYSLDDHSSRWIKSEHLMLYLPQLLTAMHRVPGKHVDYFTVLRVAFVDHPIHFSVPRLLPEIHPLDIASFDLRHRYGSSRRLRLKRVFDRTALSIPQFGFRRQSPILGFFGLDRASVLE